MSSNLHIHHTHINIQSHTIKLKEKMREKRKGTEIHREGTVTPHTDWSEEFRN